MRRHARKLATGARRRRAKWMTPLHGCDLYGTSELDAPSAPARDGIAVSAHTRPSLLTGGLRILPHVDRRHYGRAGTHRPQGPLAADSIQVDRCCRTSRPCDTTMRERRTSRLDNLCSFNPSGTVLATRDASRLHVRLVVAMSGATFRSNTAPAGMRFRPALPAAVTARSPRR